jgi:hypothetical protein
MCYPYSLTSGRLNVPLDPNEDWLVDSYGANLYGGALGTITAQVVYVGD